MMFGLPQAIITAVFDWARYLFAPLDLIRETSAQHLESNTGRLIVGYWSAPIVLCIVVDALVLRSYGIKLESDAELTLLYLTFAILKVLAGGYLLFLVLRLTGVKVTSGVTLLIFSITVVYSPLFSWIGIPQAAFTYGVAATLRAQNLGLSDALSYFLEHAKEISEQVGRPNQTIGQYLSMFSYGFYLLSTMLVAECLTQMVEVERRKAYVITAIGCALNLAPVFIFNLSQIALVFPYMTGVPNQMPQ
jgi:hypothetical protein